MKQCTTQQQSQDVFFPVVAARRWLRQHQGQSLSVQPHCKALLGRVDVTQTTSSPRRQGPALLAPDPIPSHAAREGLGTNMLRHLAPAPAPVARAGGRAGPLLNGLPCAAAAQEEASSFVLQRGAADSQELWAWVVAQCFIAPGRALIALDGVKYSVKPEQDLYKQGSGKIIYFSPWK